MTLGDRTTYLQCTLLKNKLDDGAVIYELELHNRPDNRLTPEFITKSILPALDDVERDWRANADRGDGAAALVTYGPKDANRFYSNGLDLPLAMRTHLFFPRMLNALLSRFLTFPIPTIAALNGHVFAGGFTLALVHDYRIMKAIQGKGSAMMCMNEIEFGASIPAGMMAVLKAKVDRAVLRTVLLEGKRFQATEALQAGLVDDTAPDGPATVEKAVALASTMAQKASTQAYGLIKQNMHQQALLEIALDKGNDGLGMHGTMGKAKL